jgi:hypothetical protein
MFRSFVVLATVVCAIQCTTANAQWRSGRGYRGPRSHRSSYPSSSFGFSIGIGSYPGYGYPGFGFFDPYAYDPYRYGSFRAPDLLDDPLFIESHRYDSHFPGRRRAPLVVRPAFPRATYDAYGTVTAQPSVDAAQVVPVNPADLVGQLRSACQQLSRSLSTRQDGDVWMDYLAPDEISQWIASGNSAALRELLTHYDGVVGNPQLRSIAAVGGFATTRSLLRQYVADR